MKSKTMKIQIHIVSAPLSTASREHCCSSWNVAVVPVGPRPNNKLTRKIALASFEVLLVSSTRFLCLYRWRSGLLAPEQVPPLCPWLCSEPKVPFQKDVVFFHSPTSTPIGAHLNCLCSALEGSAHSAWTPKRAWCIWHHTCHWQCCATHSHRSWGLWLFGPLQHQKRRSRWEN